MTEAQVIAHLEILRADMRDEVKRRIDSRDRYSIQMTISVAAIVGVAFSRPEFLRVPMAAPLVAIYYTVLILYSYRVHRVIAKYLREQIEPRLAALHDIPIEIEWESFTCVRRFRVYEPRSFSRRFGSLRFCCSDI